MATARLKSNITKIIEEDELPKMYDKGILDKDDFICVGCNAKAIPSSFKPSNLKRPYFRIDDHEKDCHINKYDELVKIGKKKKISNESGFPVPYPSKLYLQDKKNKVIDIESEQETGALQSITSYTENSDKEKVSTSHHRTSSTIRPIVKYFISFPYDRNIELNIPMIDKKFNTYKKIFKKISQWEFNLEQWKNEYSQVKLYYAILSVEKNNIIETDNYLSIKLLFNDYVPINLKINISNWSKRRKSEVLNELYDLSDKKRKAYNPKRKSKQNIYIFFIGNLNSINSKEFNLYNDDARLYFAEFCEIIYK